MQGLSTKLMQQVSTDNPLPDISRREAVKFIAKARVEFLAEDPASAMTQTLAIASLQTCCDVLFCNKQILNQHYY